MVLPILILVLALGHRAGGEKFEVSSIQEPAKLTKPEAKSHPSGFQYKKLEKYKRQQIGHEDIPYIDKNGCSRPGDVVCDHMSARCSYKTCVLADESQSLWKRPTMIARRTPCPYGRAVSHGFCNPYKKLLRLMGTRLSGKVQTTQNGPEKLYFVPKDPCILASDDCNASLDGSWTTTTETTTTETTISATTTSATTTSATTTSATTTGTTTLARTTAP